MNQNDSLPNTWIMSSPHFASKSLLSLLWRNFSGSMTNFSTNSTKLLHPQTNDTRNIMNYFHQYMVNYFYPYHNESSPYNDSLEYLSCPSIQYPLKNVVAIVLYLVVCVVGLFGNSLVIYVVLRFSKMQTVTNRYILNLAIADECFLIGIPFLLTTMYLNEWIFGPFLCKLYMVSTSITQFTSSIFLLIMSADRFIAVCHPISSPRFRTPLVSKIVSLIAWGTSALIMLPIMFYGEWQTINCVIHK
jgi:allatostatin C receptor